MVSTVLLDDAWFNDPHAKTVPSVHASFRDVHQGQPLSWMTSVNASFPGPTRRDGFVPVISYNLQPQVGSLLGPHLIFTHSRIPGLGERACQRLRGQQRDAQEPPLV
jgi:hypothetical protein